MWTLLWLHQILVSSASVVAEWCLQVFKLPSEKLGLLGLPRCNGKVIVKVITGEEGSNGNRKKLPLDRAVTD